MGRRQPVTAMRLLEQRVPLTLLLDLMQPPDAEELYRLEAATTERIPPQRSC